MVLPSSLFSQEALEHRVAPDRLDDLVRASPPRERLFARVTVAAVAVFLVGVFVTTIERSMPIPVVIADLGRATAADRVLLRTDAASLDDASRHALAALTPGAAVTLVGDAGAAAGRLLSAPGVADNGVAIELCIAFPDGLGVPLTDRAVLRIPAGRHSVAAAWAELAAPPVE